MQRTLSLVCSLVALAGLGACGGGWQERCKRDQARVGILQRQLDRVEARSRLLQGSLHRERMRIAQLERDLTRVRRKLLRLRYPQGQRVAVSPRKGPVSPDRLRWKVPAVDMKRVRFWDRGHRKRRSVVTTELRRLIPQWTRCYHRYGWGRGNEQSLRGEFWIIYGVQQNAVIKPRVSLSSLRLLGVGTSTASRQRHALRASRLEQCFVQAMGKLRPHAGQQLVRIAARVFVAAHRAHAIMVSDFKWPWKRVKRRRSGPNQVCRMGSRWRAYDRLRPSIARPCKRGLKCCYPCGIGGCNSVCLRRCPGPLP